MSSYLIITFHGNLCITYSKLQWKLQHCSV